jgi:hypothetical protein
MKNKSIKLLKAEIIDGLFKINKKNALVDILDYIRTFDVTSINNIEINNDEIYLGYRAAEDWDAGGWCTWDGYKVNIDDYELVRDDKRNNFGDIVQGIYKLKK